jgi:hypothetical protein
MAVKRSRQKREAIPVSLTPQQRRRLENIWFYYGNYGPKTTPGNHSFIQGLLERGEDERPCRMKGYIPTQECEKAVDEILGRSEANRTHTGERGSNAEDQREGRNHLRLVPADPTKKHFPIDPEMKEIIAEMKRRQKAVAAVVNLSDPDAA